MRLHDLYLKFPAVFFAFAAIFGLVFGSFTCAAAWRVPRGISITRGRSACDSCGTRLGPADMLPVVGYLLLRGRCGYCGERIPRRYPIGELLGGAIAALVLAFNGPRLNALFEFAAIMGLFAAAMADMDSMEIPNPFLIFLLIPAAGLMFSTPETGYLEHVIGFFCVSVPMLAIALVIPGGFGGADIKLMAVMGFALGWKGALLAMFVALLSAGIYSAAMMAAGRMTRKSQFPFGPHLALGCAAALLFAEPIIAWYLGLF